MSSAHFARPAGRCRLLTFLVLASCLLVASAADRKPEIAAELTFGPAGLTMTPRGDLIISLHQAFLPVDRVIRITKEGEISPFPNAAIASNTEQHNSPYWLDSVQGLECDDAGIVWMVDNGRRGESIPKLFAWDTRKNQLHRIIYLPSPTTLKTSFLDDLAIDPEEPFVYICDPANGTDAGLLVIDLSSGLARRVLQGHHSVIPDPRLQLAIDGNPVVVRGLDGSAVEFQTGINPITIDRKGEWLYFGPRTGTTLYRIQAEHLRNNDLTAVELASRVEGYAEKPICDGISIDVKDNIYVGDLSRKAIGVIDAKDRKYRLYSEDPRFLWIDGFCFGTEGKLYGYASQLHRSPFFNRGRKNIQGPLHIFRVRPIASGTVGR